MRLLLLVSLLSLAFGSFSQVVPPVFNDYNISFSTPYPVIDGTKYYYNHDGYTLAFKVNKEGLHIQKFDFSASPVLIKQNTIGGLPQRLSYELITTRNDITYFFYSVYDKKREELFAFEIDLENLTMKGESRVLITKDSEFFGTLYYGNRVSVVDDFRIKFSDDESKILICYLNEQESIWKKKIYHRAGFHVYDHDLNLLWEDEVKMSKNAKEMDITNFQLDNAGNVYINTRHWHKTSRKEFVRKKLNYYWEVMKVKASTGEVSTFSFDLDNKAECGTRVFMTGDGHIVYTGTYKLDKKVEHANGVSYLKSDLNGNVLAHKFHQIPVDVINKHVLRHEAGQNEYKFKRKMFADVYFPYLSISEAFMNEDGSILIHGEKSYHKKIGENHVKHFKENIFACKLDKNGDVMWMQSLGKRQSNSFSEWGSISYKHMIIEGEHYFVFMDHYDNEQLPDDKPAAMYQHLPSNKGRLVAYRVNDENGNVQKLNILDTQNVVLDDTEEPSRTFNQFGTYRVLPLPGNAFGVEMYAGEKEDVFIKIGITE